MTIPIPKLPLLALAVLFLILSIAMKLLKRDSDAAYWATVAGVCAIMALAGA